MTPLMPDRRWVVVRALPSILIAALALALAGCGSPAGEPAGPLTLTLFTSARANDEALLEWTPDPRAERWQYRQRDYPWPWGEWQDIPGSNAGTTGHRVGGLLPRQVYRFQVRPWTANGPRESSVPPKLPLALGKEIVGKPETADSIVSAYMWTGLLERGGTFRLSDAYTLTVPTSGLWFVRIIGYSPGFSLENAEPDNPFWLAIDGGTGRWLFDNPGGRPALQLGELADQILAAIRYEPVHPDPPLRALAGGGVGEVLLQWRSPPQVGAVQRWQYRHNSSTWIDVPGSDGATRSYRVGGLGTKGGTHKFQVRPWLDSGPGDAYAIANIRLSHLGGSGLPTAGGVLEPGRTFIANTYKRIAFDVPDGMLLHVTILREHYDPDHEGDLWSSTLLRDVASGSYLLLNESTGEYIERYMRPDPDGRDVGALFDQIIASTRRVPSGNFPEVVQP